MEPLRRPKLFGRRHGKALRPSQLRLLDELLPRLAVPVAASQAGASLPGSLDPGLLFPDGRPLWLEIGFGGGEHLAAAAATHPGVGLIGAEPFVNGLAMLLARVAAAGLGNVRVHPGDARDLIDRLPDASLARVFLLYPDPWPKTRHRERRLAGPETFAALARVMAPGAELRLATDMPFYVAHALAAGRSAPFSVAGPGTEPWPGWQPTRYEAKALREGRQPHYVTFTRL